MVLFPEPTQPRTGPLGGAEPAVHWFTESTRPEAIESRRVVNEWYESFPNPDGAFATRLRSEVDADHYQTLDELFIHRQLVATGNEVRYEEDGRGPDFRIYRDGALLGAVEVASLFQRQDWTDEQRRVAALTDGINDRLRPSVGYFLHVEAPELSRTPSIRRLCAFLEVEISKLPRPDDGTLPVGPGVGFERLPGAVYVEDGVRVEFHFVPIKLGAPSLTDPEARIVGSGPTTGGMVNSAERLRKRAADKAGGRYDIGNAPFAVAIGIHDTFCDNEDADQALYGREAVEISTGRLTRNNNGLFGRDLSRPDGRQRRLSAVLIVNLFRIWEPEEAELRTCHNPFAHHTWPDELFRTPTHVGWQWDRSGERVFRQY